MQSSHSSGFNRLLEPEEHQWVRDLARHQGWFLLTECLRDLMAQSLRTLVSSDSSTEDLRRAQGYYSALAEVLDIPAKLLQATPKHPGE